MMDRSPYEEFKARSFSSSIGALLVDIHNEAAPPKPKPKPKPKNYARENARRLKEIQDRCKLKEEERLKSAKKEPTFSKYKNVKSKVFTNRSSSAPSQLSNVDNVSPNSQNTETNVNRPFTAASTISLPPSASQYGDASDCTILSPPLEEILPESGIDEGEQLSEEEINKSVASIIEDDIKEVITEEEGKKPLEPPLQKMNALSLETGKKVMKKNNYIEENKLAVQRSKSPMQAVNESIAKLHQPGEVPKYLLQRQQQWKEEEIKRNEVKVDPTIPPGHKLLAEEEKRLAVEQFEKRRQSLLNSLTSLPICSDTLRVRRQRETLEKQLSDVEEQINIFSRNRVLIKYED